MIAAVVTVILLLYALATAFLLLYSVVQLHLVIRYRLSHLKKKPVRKLSTGDAELPEVTVQLPVFNERYVIERLLDSISSLDYPVDKLQIQVLDDSTDETSDIIAERCMKILAEGINIQHIRRETREGFKAGALQAGLQSATGEFIAIFDADFIPPPSFLRESLSGFTDNKTGMVQTRWGHINKNYSILTRLQAFALDAHFTVEQQGRHSGGYFMNFNGTAGIWRKAAIIDAGGWHSDTLTEDLDLSYRAQIKGWKFVYVEDSETPAELPVTMDGIKSQQYRWTKGAAETAKKNLGSVLMLKIPFVKKLHAAFHLLNSGVFICVIASAILSVPLIVIREFHPEKLWFDGFHIPYVFSFVLLLIFFWTSRSPDRIAPGIKAIGFAFTFPVFLCLSMGLSFHNAVAVIEGYTGRKTPFVRTPKFNIRSLHDKWINKKYVSVEITFQTIVEGMIALYFLAAACFSFYTGNFALLPFHLMLTTGFGLVFYYSLRHAWLKN